MGKRRWLQELIEHYLTAVRELKDTPEEQAQAEHWATWMRQQWAEHGLATLKQQRTLMTDVRKAVKEQLGPDHVALQRMNFTKAEWFAINEAQADRVAERNEQQQLIDQPEAIVARATELLESREWAAVAAGLAVLTGRRCTEILCTAQFEVKTLYSVLFTGALKRRGEPKRLRFEIPTLAPAPLVCEALAKLRRWIPTQDLDAAAVNQKYSAAVVRACDLEFRELVPLRTGRDNLYTHLFRTVYARIATHWYAPPEVAAGEFMAAIQGHYVILEEQDTTLRRSLMASRHYDDYKIGDGQGNIDGRQGIKLGLPGVQPLEVFQPKRKAEGKEMAGKSTRQPVSSLRLYREERDRWLALLDRVESQGTQPQKMSQLLQWAEQHYGEGEAEPRTAAGQEPGGGESPVTVGDLERGQSGESTAMERAWEQIATLVQALTRVAERLEQAGIPQALTTTRERERQDRSDLGQTMSDRNLTRKARSSLGPAQAAGGATGASSGSAEPGGKSGGVINGGRPMARERGRPGRSSTEADRKIHYAIDEIVKHNCQPELPREEMWAITLSVLKTATRSYQGVIQRVLEQRKQEIEQHHQRFGLGKFHNNIHRGTGNHITDVVRFE